MAGKIAFRLVLLVGMISLIIKLTFLNGRSIFDEYEASKMDQSVEMRHYDDLFLDPNYQMQSFFEGGSLELEDEIKSLHSMSTATVEQRFFKFLLSYQAHCHKMERLGNIMDGGWDICLAGPYRPRQNCLVYSFGINYDFSFDDAISKKYGCEVHSFDPSMDRGDYMRSNLVHFHNLGVDGKDHVNDKKWKLQKLETIIESLGHQNEIIDYMKMDVEGAEWETLTSALLDGNALRNVKQFSFEIHIRYYEWTKKWFYMRYSILHALEVAGFRRYYFHINPVNPKKSQYSKMKLPRCIEMYYINTHFWNT